MSYDKLQELSYEEVVAWRRIGGELLDLGVDINSREARQLYFNILKWGKCLGECKKIDGKYGDFLVYRAEIDLKHKL